MRPVLRGLIRYESLIDDGPLMYADIVRMNEALDVIEENDYRLRQAAGQG